ncbi:glycosyltransferase [Vibrio metschnikovii]|uniref:glycosyltransferase n=1 Tax=Vibrio metschnikovii TaxID=28172 RepID=UPI001C2F6E1E|nr:glycosyltransferase [Vibrio metschnikovii]
MYDYLIVTHLPAFYKVNLYNELSKKLKIFVIFIANETVEKRSSDFSNLNDANFENLVLNNESFQNRNKLSSLCKIYRIVSRLKYRKVILSGWDLPEFWLVAFCSPNVSNCLALESTIVESDISGVKGLIKKIFLSKVTTVFASGSLHTKLLEALNYKKKIIITRGVGIINKPSYAVVENSYQKRFLYIGRLSKEKNIEELIKIFNGLPNYTLNVVGDGIEKKNLELIAKDNIFFHGSVANSEIKDLFKENDLLILPSLSEPWGLVVEEALYFGLPVIVTKNCGSSELVVDKVTGFIIDVSLKDLDKVISSISEYSYVEMCKNINIFSIKEKDIDQVNVYFLGDDGDNAI